MKVLLLGGNGMLGHALAAAFKDEQLTMWDKEELDITNASACVEKIEHVRPELILNATGFTAVDQAEQERDVAFGVNAQGVENIAIVAKQIGATLVHYSTDYVFDGKSDTGYSEDATPSVAVNTYGASKLAGERVLKKINPKHYLIRTAWLYGPHGKNFVDTIVQAAHTKKELRVVNDQFGSPTYTKDLAEATRSLVTTTYAPGVYHLVNEGITTWYDFARQIVQKIKVECHVKPIPSSDYPLPARRPSHSILRNTKGPSLRPWQVALDEYIKLM